MNNEDYSYGVGFIFPIYYSSMCSIGLQGAKLVKLLYSVSKFFKVFNKESSSRVVTKPRVILVSANSIRLNYQAIVSESFVNLQPSPVIF